ncbi:alkaline phosphatase [Vibrio tritonius]|uniref:Alkaline phosphatase n=1 Tax=Vibrio tritonius TaxID=1435069 RepID=A0ABS7YQ29_9VIBR|nr:alkaline phosphatase [Vibrio tritonius]MCA2016370.1 alkaline phosphatase [Vibrio tritonius]
MINTKIIALSSLFATLVGCSATQSHVQVTNPQQNDVWYQQAQSDIAKAKANRPIDKKAKNVILFVGDGMSIGTITAARIYAGQLQGLQGEEYRLAMEKMPNMALSKTYNTDAQTPDSAGTASAMVTGVKTKQGVISIDDNVQRGFCSTARGHEAKSAWEMAAEKGLAVGVVSTARITHATPSTTYAHSADRDWENDAAMPNIAKNQGCKDIAQQLLTFNGGKGMDVVFGGGRREFLPNTVVDEEGSKGKRKDGRNLITEWEASHPQGQYVYDKKGFDQIAANGQPVFGLFEPSHMKYDIERKDEEPSLADMTTKAIDLLSQKKQGYILMVEAGRIDHAHHDGNAARALSETVAYDNAIKAALAKTNPEDTLVIVTADHAHTLISNGYADRGNPILGLSKKNGRYNLDDYGKRYTTLMYGNGPGAVATAGAKRPNPTEKEVLDVNYHQQSLLKLASETHSGEDVAIFARGPQAYLFQGAVEQNYIFHVMNEALQLTE